MEVKVGGRGRTTREDLTMTRSSMERSSPLTGSLPFSSMYFSIRRFSKTAPGQVSGLTLGQAWRSMEHG